MISKFEKKSTCSGKLLGISLMWYFRRDAFLSTRTPKNLTYLGPKVLGVERTGKELFALAS